MAMPEPGDRQKPEGVTGLQRLPRVRQPDGYTCGSTCVRIVLNHLEFLPHTSLAELTRMMGTNPVTGTTDVEMGRGLLLAGLSHAHPSTEGLGAQGAALGYLERLLGDGQLVMLRTLMSGCKHWIVVHGCRSDGTFLCMCPSRGAISLPPPQVFACWAARGFDHFSVPARRSLHPVALASEAAARLAGWKPVHAMTLGEFTGGAPVIDDRRQSAWHRRMVDEAADALRRPGRPEGRLLDYRIPGCPGVSFTGHAREGCIDDMILRTRADGRVLGGIHNGVRWVEPRERGRGLGAELALAAFSEPDRRYLQPGSYSEAGYGSRLSAHRIAVARALEAGLEVADPGSSITVQPTAEHQARRPVRGQSRTVPGQLGLRFG